MIHKNKLAKEKNNLITAKPWFFTKQVTGNGKYEIKKIPLAQF